MEDSPLAQALDHLTLGLVWIHAGQVAWLNRLMRAQLAADAAAYAALCAQQPALAALSFASAPASEPITLADGQHRVSAYGVGDDRVLVFLPTQWADALLPELAQVRQTCADFEEIYRNSFDGIFVTDGSGVTLLVNEGCERNYGISASDMIGRHVSELDAKGWIRPVIAGKVAQTGERINATQRTHEGKTIMVTGIPLFDEHGQVRRVIINSRDTTELVLLQQDLSRAQEDLRRVDSEIEALRSQVLKVDGMVLNSPAMQKLASLAMRVAKVDTTVLISGESGVGKEVVTRLIHNESARAKGPFIKINCGALPRDLLESELFGYDAGAFTGAQRHGKHGLMELAAGDTLFLDEIGEIPLDLQVKLLTVLQDRTVVHVGGTRTIPIDIRVVAATNRDLKVMIAQRKFRADLYYRLNVVAILVPTLAERREVILPLVQQFLAEFNSQYGLDRSLSERALGRLHDHAWPGNVRELRNVVERLVVTSPERLINLSDVDEVLPMGWERANAPERFQQRLARYERLLLEEAMQAHGSTRAVAKALGLSQSSVVRKLKRGQEAAP